MPGETGGKMYVIIKLAIVTAFAYFIWKESGVWTATGFWIAFTWCESVRSVVDHNGRETNNLIARYLILETSFSELLEVLKRADGNDNETKH